MKEHLWSHQRVQTDRNLANTNPDRLVNVSLLAGDAPSQIINNAGRPKEPPKPQALAPRNLYSYTQYTVRLIKVVIRFLMSNRESLSNS